MSTHCLSQDVYYISIGQRYYKHKKNSKKYEKDLPDIDGANLSAVYVSEYLEKYANAKGSLVMSKKGEYFDLEGISDEIFKVVEKAQESDDPEKLVVIYYCGHCFSEKFGRSQFIVPSDYLVDTRKDDIVELVEGLIPIRDLYDLVYDHRVNFMFLLDCCNDGEMDGMPKFRKVLPWLDKIDNGYRLDYPILLSSKPGTLAKTVEDPIAGNPLIKIGPLARRFILGSEETLRQEKIIYIKDIIDAMFLEDELTPEPYTKWNRNELVGAIKFYMN